MFRFQKLFSFSLETEAPVSACLHTLQHYPSFSLEGQHLSIRSLTVDEKTNSFCLTIGNSNVAWQGAKAIGRLEAVNGHTMVHGEMQNLAWKYLFFVPYLLFVPVFLLLIVAAVSLEQKIGFVLLPVFLLFVGYIYPTMRYRKMAIGAIQKRITPKSTGI